MALEAAACAAGFVLFRRNTVPIPPSTFVSPGKLSVIIPARNEETNLPYLLASLQNQTLPPFEIIVVDDCSEDRTREIAESFGITVIAGSPPPPGWTGKNWAVWNGYLQSIGEFIAFLDGVNRRKNAEGQCGNAQGHAAVGRGGSAVQRDDEPVHAEELRQRSASLESSIDKGDGKPQQGCFKAPCCGFFFII